MLNFQSQVTIGADMAKYTDEEIKNETMFFNCSILFALKEGGPITKEFISHLPDRFIAEGILDSRVHRQGNLIILTLSIAHCTAWH